MPDTFKFPDGYDVTVCRKQDIIDCLDENITDKEVVLAVISQCEIDASNFIKAGRWTGIPFMGSIRVPKHKQILDSNPIQELIEEARNELDINKYMVFRHKLNIDIKKQEKHERYYRYIVSHFVANNKKFYNNLLQKYDENTAQFICWTLCNATIGAPKEQL